METLMLRAHEMRHIMGQRHPLNIRMRAAIAETHFLQAIDALQKGENEAKMVQFLLDRRV